MAEHMITIGGAPFDLAGSVEYASGAIVSKTLLEKEKGTITVFAFDQGQGLSEHVAPFDATVLVLEGESKITVGGQDHTVTAGELLVMPANVPHALAATKRFKMLLVMIRSD